MNRKPVQGSFRDLTTVTPLGHRTSVRVLTPCSFPLIMLVFGNSNLEKASLWKYTEERQRGQGG